MAITNLGELKSEVIAWARRSNFEGSDAVNFIRLAEDRINLDIRYRKTVSDPVAVTLTDGAGALPDGLLRIHSLKWPEAIVRRPSFLPVDKFESLHACAGDPRHYTTSGNQLMIWPIPEDPFDVTLTYSGKVTALDLADDNSTSWLLLEFPSIYLQASLVEVGQFLKDKALIGFATGRYDGLMVDLNNLGIELHGERLQMSMSSGSVV